jgi:gliding motility-associated lipoprotein GldH
MNKFRPYIFAILFFISTFLFNCSNDYIYQSEVDIPDGKWQSGKVPAFKPELTDTAQLFNIRLSITNSNDYRYNNVWLFIKSISPRGYSKIDTVEVFLAEEDGKWLGKKDNDLFTSRINFKRKVRFPEAGIYTFEIIQGMRDLELKGIYNIGFGLEKTE